VVTRASEVRLGDPRPDDEPEAGVLQREQVRRGQHPRVGDHTTSAPWWRSANPVRTGMRVVVSALLPANRCTSNGNPDASVSSPTVT